MSQIQKIEQFRKELALAETYEDIKALDAKASAIAEFARRNRVSKQKQDELGEFRIEIEAKKGAWLDEFFPHGGDVKSQRSTSNNSSLIDIGITYDESANARLISKEQEIVRDVVEQLKKDDNKVVTPFAVQREVRKIKRESLSAEISKNNDKLDTKKKYRVIYADPPWKYGNTMPEYFTEQADHYPLMSIKEICQMPVKEIVEDNAVLFLWVTSPILEESFEVINAWGFKYKASFVWDKIKHNMGHYNSVRHELLLICTRGSCQPDVRKLYDSVQSIERTEHSKKPEEFRQIIDHIYCDGNRIELFARKQTENWEVWGNESKL